MTFVPNSTGLRKMLSVGVVPPTYVPAIEITLVEAYPVPPLTTCTSVISKLPSLVILNTAPDPDPSVVEGTLEYMVVIPVLVPVVLVTGNVRSFAGVVPPKCVPAILTLSVTKYPDPPLVKVTAVDIH